jgi:hypothetical protein
MKQALARREILEHAICAAQNPSSGVSGVTSRKRDWPAVQTELERRRLPSWQWLGKSALDIVSAK